MAELSLIENLIDPKVLKILQVFFDDEEKEFYLSEVSKRSGVAPASVFRILKTLFRIGILDMIMVNKFKFYKVKKNKETDTIKTLIKKDKRILDLFVERIREMEGVKQIVLHGAETKDKADLLVIGDNIDASFVKTVAFEIKDKYNFTISWLALTIEQYEQMSSMGLYGGDKKPLFLRKTSQSQNI